MPAASVESVTLKNPRVMHALDREMAEGAGRNATETAENLILEAAEQRRVTRESTGPVFPHKAKSERNAAKVAPEG